MFDRDVGKLGAETIGPDLRVLDGIANWCGGLHGSMPLDEALSKLATGFGAVAAVLSRQQHNQDRPRKVAAYDLMTGVPDEITLIRPLCDDVMGYLYSKARSGTVWFLSDHTEDPAWSKSQTLDNWCVARDISEVTVVALGGDARHSDFLEFHFAEPLEYSQKLELESLAPTLTRAWSGRKAGLVTQAQMDVRMVRHRAAAQQARLKPDAPILDMSNPARLSRAEYRVCLMLARGLSVKGLVQELGLSESTIRSHLRSIYSKTEVSGMPELMYRILSAPVDQIEVRRATS